jgi:hypothetical protein
MRWGPVWLYGLCALIALLLTAGPTFAGACDDYDKDVTWGDEPTLNCEVFHWSGTDWDLQNRGTTSAQAYGGSCTASAPDGFAKTWAKVAEPLIGPPSGVRAKAEVPQGPHDVGDTQTVERGLKALGVSLARWPDVAREFVRKSRGRQRRGQVLAGIALQVALGS